MAGSVPPSRRDAIGRRRDGCPPFGGGVRANGCNRAMSWYELLLFLHVLAMATWFGSGLAITVVAFRLLGVGREAFASFVVPAGWWAGRAHPAAAVVLLLTGFGLIGDSDAYGFGDTWVWLGLVGWVVLLAIGGALIGRTSDAMVKRIQSGGEGALADVDGQARRLLLYTRIELALLVLVIADMVAKPGA